MIAANPHLAALERHLGELERAPLLQKATAAAAVARASMRVLEDFERRLARLEARQEPSR